MPQTDYRDTGSIFVIACILLCIWGVMFVQAVRLKHFEPIAVTPSTSTAAVISPMLYPWVTYVPVPISSPSPSPTPLNSPSLQAKSALFYNLSDQKLLLAHRASEIYPIASITKLMTALIAVEHYGLNASTTLVLENEDLMIDSPSKVLAPGDTLRFSEAIRILLISSDNSVANLLARSAASTTALFVSEMNTRAYSLGMTRTRFTDPIGFSGNVSSALDLASFTGYLSNHYPELLRITSYPSLTLILESGKVITVTNTNILADKIPGFIGGKTGFLDEVGGSLVTVFKLRETVFVTVVLESADRFGDTSQLIQWYLRQ